MSKSDLYDFDPVLLSRARLAILSALVTLREAEFMDLKHILGLSQGNLSIHGGKLEQAGYISVRKEFVDRKPRTTFSITPEGRRALVDHVQRLQNVIKEA
ncbi:MAG TPA: transcriptional regulator [Planctomycetota bacterium]|jgi:DNA-binding MarR family transcriptional regulator|nr:transcriptional regulator [Planctomycetota bacterium]